MYEPWCAACVKRLAVTKAGAAATSAAMKIVAASRVSASPEKRRRVEGAESAPSASATAESTVAVIPDALGVECSGGSTCSSCKKAKKGCDPVSPLSLAYSLAQALHKPCTNEYP